MPVSFILSHIATNKNNLYHLRCPFLVNFYSNITHHQYSHFSDDNSRHLDEGKVLTSLSRLKFKFSTTFVELVLINIKHSYIIIFYMKAMCSRLRLKTWCSEWKYAITPILYIFWLYILNDWKRFLLHLTEICSHVINRGPLHYLWRKVASDLGMRYSFSWTLPVYCYGFVIYLKISLRNYRQREETVRGRGSFVINVSCRSHEGWVQEDTYNV